MQGTHKAQTSKPQTYWLVGASAGIGLALCEKLLQAGDQVIASSRTAQDHPALQSLVQKYPDHLTLLDIDVSDTDQLDARCKQAWSAFEGIDCWIYNVGSYEPLTLDQWQFSQFEQMNQTNYLGAVGLMIALRPYFLQQSTGRWVWNISLASDFGLPYAGAYSAPKAALMNLAESIQPELQQHNITLQVINHGFVKTRLTAKNDFPMLGLMEVDHAAERILKGLKDHKHFEIRFPWNLATLLGTLKRLPKSWALNMSKKALKK